MKKIIISIGLLCIFISVFFTLFILDNMIKFYKKCCLETSTIASHIQELGFYILISVIFIIFFVIVDFAIIHIMLTSWTYENIRQKQT